MSAKLRLVPVVIFAAVLLLSVRIGGLWDNIEIAVGKTSVAEASKAPEVTKPAEGMKPGAPPKAAAKGNGKTMAPKPRRRRNPGGDLTDTDIKLLQQLAKRRQALDERERAISLREGMLKAFERRLNQKVKELKKIQAAVEAELARYDKKRNGELARLVKIYSNMKPKNAARVFDELELPIAIEVLRQMRAQASAPILAAMQTDKAKAITAALARKRELRVLGK
jgi:flagellar motility protein MotE (MotC chaperone)